MPYEPIVPKGHHLGDSRNVDGAVTGHLFEDGTNKLKGHAAWHWVDDDPVAPPHHQGEPRRDLTPEEKELIDAFARLIVEGTIRAIVAATPYLKRLWDEKIIPKIESAQKRVTRIRASKPHAAEAAPVPDSVEYVVAETTRHVSAAMWEERFHAMVKAGTFKSTQLQILSNARIADGDLKSSQPAAGEPLTPQQFADRIKHMLEANPSLLDEETAAELSRVFNSRVKTSNEDGRLELET